MLEVHTLPALSDNYVYLIHDHKSRKNIVIDPSTSEIVSEFLEEKKWTLDEIWSTHHHWDHTGGNLELKEKYNCKIFGPDKGLKALQVLIKSNRARSVATKRLLC